MMYCIVIFLISFVWLLFETQNLTVRLPVGKAKSNEYIEALTQMVDANWIEIESYLIITPKILQLTTKVSNLLMLSKPDQPSYFIPCDLDEPEFQISKTIVNVGAKIL